VAEESFPLLCSILFGFLGAFFGAVAAAPKDAVLLVQNFDLYFLTFKARDAILITSGCGGIAFFMSALLAMYAKMFSVTTIPSNEEEKTVAQEFMEIRAKFLLFSAISFNIGVVIAPTSGFFLISAPAIFVVLFVYAVAIVFAAIKLQ
jgi:hypothetical protein